MRGLDPRSRDRRVKPGDDGAGALAARGFAVVASEVRALAQRSAGAAKQIKELITSATTEVGAGVKLVAETGVALKSIASMVAEIDALVCDIADGAQDQATAIHEINTVVAQMDQATQQNAAMAEEATAASRSLRTETDSLRGQISRFRIGGEPDANATERRDLMKTAPHGFRPTSETSASRRPQEAGEGWRQRTSQASRKKVANGADVDENGEHWDEF